MKAFKLFDISRLVDITYTLQLIDSAGLGLI